MKSFVKLVFASLIAFASIGCNNAVTPERIPPKAPAATIIPARPKTEWKMGDKAWCENLDFKIWHAQREHDVYCPNESEPYMLPACLHVADEKLGWLKAARSICK